MVHDKENLWFLLKRSTSEFILPEKTSKRIKTVFFKILVIKYFRTSEFRRKDHGALLLNEKLPVLPHDLTIFLNWDSLYARLNSDYEATKKKYKKIKT